MIYNDEQLVELFNRMTNSNEPQDRVTLASEIANDFGRWLMCPSPLIEQLVNKLEHETNFVATHEPSNPTMRLIVGVLRPEVVERATKITAMIRAFLEVRPQMIAALNKRFPTHPIPD